MDFVYRPEEVHAADGNVRLAERTKLLTELNEANDENCDGCGSEEYVHESLLRRLVERIEIRIRTSLKSGKVLLYLRAAGMP